MLYYLSTNGIGISAHDPPALFFFFFFSLFPSEHRSSPRNDFSDRAPGFQEGTQGSPVSLSERLDRKRLHAGPRRLAPRLQNARRVRQRALVERCEVCSRKRGHGPSPSAIFLPLYGSIGGLGGDLSMKA